MRIEIKSRLTGDVLFALDEEGATFKIAVERAVGARVDLSYSDLSYSDLRGSNLRGSDLSYSDLRYSDLSYSDLSYSNLSGSDLSYSNLSGSDLSGSNLSGSNLRGSNLSYSDLSGSNLRGSDLSYSDLSYSDLSGSDLSGSNLSYSNLRRDLKLVGKRPYLDIGPIGSSADTLQAWLTDKGIYITAGCFFGTRDEFAAKVTDTHPDNRHGREYAAALMLIDAHAREWTPVAEQKVAA